MDHVFSIGDLVRFCGYLAEVVRIRDGYLGIGIKFLGRPPWMPMELSELPYVWAPSQDIADARISPMEQLAVRLRLTENKDAGDE